MEQNKDDKLPRRCSVFAMDEEADLCFDFVNGTATFLYVHQSDAAKTTALMPSIGAQAAGNPEESAHMAGNALATPAGSMRLACAGATATFLKRPIDLRMSFSTLFIVLALHIPDKGWASTVYHAAQARGSVPARRWMRGLPVNVYRADRESGNVSLAYMDTLSVSFSNALIDAALRQLTQPRPDEEALTELRRAHIGQQPEKGTPRFSAWQQPDDDRAFEPYRFIPGAVPLAAAIA